MSKFRDEKMPEGKIVKTFKEFGGSWENYCRYLVKNGEPDYSSKNLPAPPAKRNVVPWYGKMWGEIDENMKQKIRVHIAELAIAQGKDRALDYCKFLYDKAGAPKDFHKEIFQ